MQRTVKPPVKRLGVAAALVDGVLVDGDVGLRDGAVEQVGLPGGGSGTAVPGLVDLQVNGYAGVDFLTAPAQGWRSAGRALAGEGVTAYVANLLTCPPRQLEAALRTAAEVVAGQRAGGDGEARLLGVHLEGPYLAPTRAGAHPVEQLRLPSTREAGRWLDAGPVVAMTLAPELPGALELVRYLRSRGVLVSLGHSEANAAQARAGFDAGARSVTHVLNAMPPLSARAPGLAGVALTRTDVAVQLLCDGVHLAAEMAALVVAAARERFVLVSDVVAAAGAAGGHGRLGSVDVIVSGGQARRADGTLAGSAVSLGGVLGRAVAAGASFEEAVAAATSRPASLVGRLDLGRLRAGGPADVVVVDDSLAVRRTLIAGVEVG